MLSLSALNTMPPTEFVAALGEVFEHAPWVAGAVASQRPFATVTAMHDAMMAVVRGVPVERLLVFLQAHPELGSKVKRADWTPDSQAEQGALGLDRLSHGEFERFQSLNSAYRQRFGIPFIVCVRRQTRDAILEQFARRLDHDRDQEIATALDEIAFITRLRLVARVDGPGMPKTGGRLSTHVLDTHVGKPAPGVRIDLCEVGQSARSTLASVTTNADGRTDSPLLAEGPLRIGTYELMFYAGDYFRARGTPLAEPAFIDVVPLRFSVAEPEGHYHVPLLVTPWSYSTYRGS
jgi:2-oxo-4-hydroxy-4-carboxy-5-ureidoimidazoline decarboxylase